jgi:hypothetical protein
MAATAESFVKPDEVEQLRGQLNNAQAIFKRQSDRLQDLELECDEAGLARDKALYWLFRFCEAVERGELALVNDELKEVNENALNVLFDNNIFVGLDEPDAAILRLMEAVARDQEGHDEAPRQN